MSRKVVVSGSEDRVEAVAGVLVAEGYEVHPCTRVDGLANLAVQLGPGSLHGYVQLAVRIPASGSTVVERLHGFLTDGLLARFEAVAAVFPALASDGVVLLVGGNHPDELHGPDDQPARLALLQVLAHGLRADAGEGVRVRVVHHERSPEEIVDIFLRRAPNRMKKIDEFAAQTDDMPYDDWRLALMGLGSIEA